MMDTLINAVIAFVIVDSLAYAIADVVYNAGRRPWWYPPGIGVLQLWRVTFGRKGKE